MYNYYPQQQVTNPIIRQPAMTPFILKGRPVSSLEEVRAQSIDFDGSVFYFPDVANKRIYTKQINMDGTASLNMYELKPIPQNAPNGDYVTRAEFEQALLRLQDNLQQRSHEPQAQVAVATTNPQANQQQIPPANLADQF